MLSANRFGKDTTPYGCYLRDSKSQQDKQTSFYVNIVNYLPIIRFRSVYIICKVTYFHFFSNKKGKF